MTTNSEENLKKQRLQMYSQKLELDSARISKLAKDIVSPEFGESAELTFNAIIANLEDMLGSAKRAKRDQLFTNEGEV